MMETLPKDIICELFDLLRGPDLVNFCQINKRSIEISQKIDWEKKVKEAFLQLERPSMFPWQQFYYRLAFEKIYLVPIFRNRGVTHINRIWLYPELNVKRLVFEINDQNPFATIRLYNKVGSYIDEIYNTGALYKCRFHLDPSLASWWDSIGLIKIIDSPSYR